MQNKNLLKVYITSVLKTLSFVNWDRFTQPTESEYHFYGWIERDKDSNKDFVVISIVDDTVWFITSSKKYSNEISQILNGKNDNSIHAPCQRVEDHFEIKNSIKLK